MLNSFLAACEADSRGRLNYENKAYPQAEYYRTAYRAASQVNISDLLESGATGDEIQSTLRKRRVKAIRHGLSQPAIAPE